MDIKDTLKRLSELQATQRTDAGGELASLVQAQLPALLDHIERLEAANRALRHEQQRLRRAPERDWQQLSTAMAPLFAKLVEIGCGDMAKTGIAAMDQTRTYINRVLTERDALAARENQTT